MMNNPDAAAGPWWWCCDDDNAGEATAAAAVPTTGESGSFFADVVADYSTDELFELVWEQGGQDCGGASGSMQPAVSCLWSPKFSSKPPDVRLDPPSEDEMAAWLSVIVKGEELACNDDDDGSRRPTTDDGRDVAPAKGDVVDDGDGQERKDPNDDIGRDDGQQVKVGD
ncbi:unnamed protein product [Miscanthus lutarioriparius]|uniref:Uncharacterized protein n=1 Tax=Miscanthus lutarioriparius TaxID=422564 RepID=A0A811RIE9_9POAL|nr:unnamed protein product [Miscanthus lutarioriparius]